MLVYVLFVIGFVILIKGADILVDGSVTVAKKFNISNIVIGLTIVAFGTSAPELIINIIASAEGNTEIAIGNILGSNIANILLVLGISAIVNPITTNKNTTWKEIPFSLLAIILVGILVNAQIIDGIGYSGLSRSNGLILIAFFIIFLYYVFGITKSSKDLPQQGNIKEIGYLKAIIYIITGLLGLMIGGKWIVDGAVKIAQFLNISQSFIGLTIVALGTSLPELATSAVAAYKKHTDIAIGNVVGSNIFNIFWVLGLSAIIRPLPFKSAFNADLLMAIFSSTILLLIMFIDKKRTIKRWHGVLMIAVYLGYISYLTIRG